MAYKGDEEMIDYKKKYHQILKWSIGREHQIDRVTELCKEQNEVDPKEIIKMLEEND